MTIPAFAEISSVSDHTAKREHTVSTPVLYTSRIADSTRTRFDCQNSFQPATSDFAGGNNRYMLDVSFQTTFGQNPYDVRGIRTDQAIRRCVRYLGMDTRDRLSDRDFFRPLRLAKYAFTNHLSPDRRTPPAEDRTTRRSRPTPRPTIPLGG